MEHIFALKTNLEKKQEHLRDLMFNETVSDLLRVCSQYGSQENLNGLDASKAFTHLILKNLLSLSFGF